MSKSSTANEKNIWVETKKYNKETGQYDKAFIVIKGVRGEVVNWPYISVINGDAYNTKFGQAVSIPLITGNIEQMIEGLELLLKFFKEGK